MPPALYRRDVGRVHEAWFSDMEAVKAGVGLIDETLPVGGADEKAKVGASLGWGTLPICIELPLRVAHVVVTCGISPARSAQGV